MRKPIFEIQDLRKQYRSVVAVDGIGLRIPEGICFGLLGPNGAGKTTTVEMMEGIRRPTSGQILYKGEPMSGRFKSELGIQFQTTALPDFLTVREALNLFRSLYPRQADMDEICRLCSLHDILKRDTRKLSGGQRQRVLLAIALVNDPEILFLDEPTTGLDPQARRNFWDLVEGIRAKGKTIVLTTHYMEEAHVLCDEIAIVDHGRIIAQGNPEVLLGEQFEGTHIRIPIKDWTLADGVLPWACTRMDHWMEIQTGQVNETMQALLDRGVSLAGVQVHKATLEDLFLQLTGKGLKE